MQYYLSRGYGVMMPNVRGSTGYGRSFQMMDDYKKRWDSVRDGVDAVEWLVKNGYSEPGRIAAYGGSYGGFMSVGCVVEDQERVERGERKERLFGACVDIVGVVNLKTFLEKTSGYRRKLREVEYGPLTDPEFLASVSSIHRVDKIKVPVFIAHGFNDPRVPVEEAMQLAAALRERGQNPRMFVAPDEGHGFAKLDNRVYFGERVASFLDETIGRNGKTSAAN
jgi:dipeptidyl aminopeptidase/acylaminoacyl peptidase